MERGAIMIRVIHKHDRSQWGYIDGEGTLKVESPPVEYKVVRVLWANDAVIEVPPSLQYAEDLEIIP
jgi:hypothetical protein